MTRKSSEPGVGTRARSGTITSTAQGSGRVLTAAGEWYPPAGRRHLGVVIVKCCPKCAHLHLHRAVSPDTAHGAERVGSCGTTYTLSVRMALPVGSFSGREVA